MSICKIVYFTFIIIIGALIFIECSSGRMLFLEIKIYFNRIWLNVELFSYVNGRNYDNKLA